MTCKGNLLQVFIRVYETGNTASHVGIFDPALNRIEYNRIFIFSFNHSELMLL